MKNKRKLEEILGDAFGWHESSEWEWEWEWEWIFKKFPLRAYLVGMKVV